MTARVYDFAALRAKRRPQSTPYYGPGYEPIRVAARADGELVDVTITSNDCPVFQALFTPQEARDLAALLKHQAAEAERHGSVVR